MIDEKFVKKNGKAVKLSSTHCQKCNRDLDIRMTTELPPEVEKKGKVQPQTIIIYGICSHCKVVYVLNMVQIKDIPIIPLAKTKRH